VRALLLAAPRDAVIQLHALEGEVLALLAVNAPGTDLSAIERRRADFRPD
jgi:hypothetical protein